MNFYLGCAVWSFKDWVGNLYPAKSQPRNFLHLYSRRFTTVEGNTTFYAVPSNETIKKWREQTTPGFKFCPKLHRQITHQGLLVPQLKSAMSFLERMSGLAERLGVIFIQLPPSYSPEYFADLAHFLNACTQAGLSLALEVRHPAWFQPDHGDRLNNLLAQLKITRVLLDTRPIYNCPDDPQVNSERKKPQLPLQPIILGDTALVRFISHPLRLYSQSYLQEWNQQITKWLNQGKTVYFFVHCPQESQSPDTAKYFYALLNSSGQNQNLPNLPWNALKPEPTQLSLF